MKAKQYPPTPSQIWCDCGQEKATLWAKTCSRCRFLDGESWLEQVIIGLLRNFRWLSRMEIEAEIKGSSRRAIVRTLQRLWRSGRLIKEETYQTHVHDSGRTSLAIVMYRLCG